MFKISNTPLPNIIGLQYGDTPIDSAKNENRQECVNILQTAMVCYFNVIIEPLMTFSLHPHYQLIH